MCKGPTWKTPLLRRSTAGGEKTACVAHAYTSRAPSACSTLAAFVIVPAQGTQSEAQCVKGATDDPATARRGRTLTTSLHKGYEFGEGDVVPSSTHTQQLRPMTRAYLSSKPATP